MSFRDCILGKIEKGALEKNKGEALLKKYDATLERYNVRGLGPTAAASAAEDLLKTELAVVEKKQRNIRQHALKQQEINLKLNKEAAKGTIEKAVSNELHLAADRVETVRNWAMSMLSDVADKLAVNWNGLSKDYAGFEKGLRSMLGEVGHGAEAEKLGNAMKTVFESMRERFSQAGGVIGKIDNYFPQVHAKETISKVSSEEWKNFISPLLDNKKMINEDTGRAFTPAELSSVLDNTYKNIVTSGRHDMAKLSTHGEMIVGRGGDLDMAESQSRFLHFKDADSFLTYNSKFGVGDNGLMAAFTGHIQTMSRKIAVLEKFGPKPNAMMKFMDFKMKAEGQAPFKRRWAQAEYRILTSQFEHGDADSTWYRMLTGTQNWIRGSMLGGGVLSALPDTMMMSATAKINGLDAVRTLGNYLHGILPGSAEVKTLAHRSGYISEVISGSALGDTRFAGESAGKGAPRYFANMMNEISGLQRTTRATMDAISMEASATLAEHIETKTPWTDLHPDLKNNLEHYGFTESDWSDLHNAGTFDNGRAKFLITSELRVDPNLDPKISKGLADKIDDWVNNMRRAAATEPTLATRALTSGAIMGGLNSGAGGLATPERAIASTLGLFKSFPITSIMTHLLPAIRRAAVDRKFDHAAMVLFGTTVMGAVAQQLKDVSKGKTPQDMNSYQFWTRATLQGGGLGLYGDFIFGDYSRFGRSPLTELGGPVVGLIDDLMGATKGNLDKVFAGDGERVDRNIGRDLFRVAKRNIPLVSVWYGRLAVERLVLDNLERLIDPNFDSRIGKYERKMKSETGQEFWWRPGETRPK